MAGGKFWRILQIIHKLPNRILLIIINLWLHLSIRQSYPHLTNSEFAKLSRYMVSSYNVWKETEK